MAIFSELKIADFPGLCVASLSSIEVWEISPEFRYYICREARLSW